MTMNGLMESENDYLESNGWGLNPNGFWYHVDHPAGGYTHAHALECQKYVELLSERKGEQALQAQVRKLQGYMRVVQNWFNNMPEDVEWGEFRERFESFSIEEDAKKLYREILALPGVTQIAEERERQIVEEGFSLEHDDEHGEDYALVLAAICFATPVKVYRSRILSGGGIAFYDPWPDEWVERWDKRKRYGENRGELGRVPPDPVTYKHYERIDLLVKAGALIAAEIDRLNREAEREKEEREQKT